MHITGLLEVQQQSIVQHGTYKKCDLPAPYPVDLEIDLFDLIARQLYAAANFIISHMNSGSTTNFRVVTGTRSKLYISIMLDLSNQL